MVRICLVSRFVIEVCRYFDHKWLVKSKNIIRPYQLNSTLENPEISQIKFYTIPSKQQMPPLLRDCLVLQSFLHIFDSCTHISIFSCILYTYVPTLTEITRKKLVSDMSQNFLRLLGKHQSWNPFLSAVFLKKDSVMDCFPFNFAELFTVAFYPEHLCLTLPASERKF